MTNKDEKTQPENNINTQDDLFDLKEEIDELIQKKEFGNGIYKIFDIVRNDNSSINNLVEYIETKYPKEAPFIEWLSYFKNIANNPDLNPMQELSKVLSYGELTGSVNSIDKAITTKDDQLFHNTIRILIDKDPDLLKNISAIYNERFDLDHSVIFDRPIISLSLLVISLIFIYANFLNNLFLSTIIAVIFLFTTLGIVFFFEQQRYIKEWENAGIDWLWIKKKINTISNLDQFN